MFTSDDADDSSAFVAAHLRDGRAIPTFGKAHAFFERGVKIGDADVIERRHPTVGARPRLEKEVDMLSGGAGTRIPYGSLS